MKFSFRLLVFIMFLSNLLQAQVVKHPRVSELENLFVTEATQYLKSRFPNLPFLVTVSIDPLRRDTNSGYIPEREKLPYYDLEEEKIRDEWDDPMSSIYVLTNRIRRAQVNVSLPQTVSDAELLEIKDAMLNILKLVPARDQVNVRRKNWNMGPDMRTYGSFLLAALLLLLMGFFVIGHYSARKIGKSLEAAQAKSNASAPPPSTPSAPIIQPDNSSSKKESGGGFGSGEIKMRDPLRTRQFIASRIDELISSNIAFPTLEDMMLLDRLAAKNPGSLGALMIEFPVENQKLVFSHSHDPAWLQAFSDPGELDTEAVLILEKLSRITPKDEDRNWQNLLIQIWRLGDAQTNFLKTLKSTDSMSILNDLPKSIALPIARKVFPGSWGALLDPNYNLDKPGDNVVRQIYDMALKIKPMRQFEAIDIYRHEKDMLEYLRIAEVPEESDIYEASSKTSFIHSERPPFYLVFNQDDEIRNQIIGMVSPSDWAIALFNSPRDLRFKLDSLFTKKQKFLFLDSLKQLDKDQPKKETVGLMREKIGSLLRVLLKQSGKDEFQVAAGDEIGTATVDSEVRTAPPPSSTKPKLVPKPVAQVTKPAPQVAPKPPPKFVQTVEEDEVPIPIEGTETVTVTKPAVAAPKQAPPVAVTDPEKTNSVTKFPIPKTSGPPVPKAKPRLRSATQITVNKESEKLEVTEAPKAETQVKTKPAENIKPVASSVSKPKPITIPEPAETKEDKELEDIARKLIEDDDDDKRSA